MLVRYSVRHPVSYWCIYVNVLCLFKVRRFILSFLFVIWYQRTNFRFQLICSWSESIIRSYSVRSSSLILFLWFFNSQILLVNYISLISRFTNCSCEFVFYRFISSWFHHVWIFIQSFTNWWSIISLLHSSFG